MYVYAWYIFLKNDIKSERCIQSIDFRVSRGGSYEGRVSRLRFW